MDFLAQVRKRDRAEMHFPAFLYLLKYLTSQVFPLT
jgi:hypothetical protein